MQGTDRFLSKRVLPVMGLTKAPRRSLPKTSRASPTDGCVLLRATSGAIRFQLSVASLLVSSFLLVAVAFTAIRVASPRFTETITYDFSEILAPAQNEHTI